MSSEVTGKMATTHFEVIGVIGIDKIGVRHYRKHEVGDNLHNFESMLMISLDCHDLVSIVRFKIDSGKKHQIRAHTSQILNAPLILDYKYGYSESGFKSDNFKALLNNYPSMFRKYIQYNIRTVNEKFTTDLDSLQLKNNLNSLKDNNTIFLHSYHLKLNFSSKAGEEIENTEVKARFSLQIREFLKMIGADEKAIYEDADI